MKSTTRKSLVCRLDALCSLEARLWTKKHYGPMCPLCGKAPHTQAFHFLTRTKYATRWDSDNLIASCGGCNIKYEHDVTFIEKIIEWYRNNRGNVKWDQLKKRGHEIAKFTNTQLQDMAKEKIKSIEAMK